MKYLSEELLLQYLKLGKPVEQWLGSENRSDYTIIKWLRIEREKNGNYSVVFFEAFDEGNEDFLDIYEFSSTDPDIPYGKIDSFEDSNEALVYTLVEYGCKKDRFVNAGMIQEEYREYLSSKGG